MCIFTDEIQHVSSTRIFASMEGYKQALIYDMYLSTGDDTAMVLPIPVTLEKGGNPVEFVDLSGYAEVFDDLHDLFPQILDLSLGLSEDGGAEFLEVEQVGEFEASFVSNPSEFSRLDPRFRLSNSVLEKIPAYTDYGFVVFKLRKGASKIHPMAFWFETRDVSKLFYPTVHVHDGSVHITEEFDHALYAQGSLLEHPGLGRTYGLVDSTNGLENREKLQKMVSKSKCIVSDDSEIYRQLLVGELPNKDTWFNLK